MREERAMSREPPSWSPDAESATVLMEYLKRASPQFVAAELDELGLLEAADQAAAAKLARVAALRASPRHARASLWMFALAMCAMIVVVAETRHFSSINLLPDDGASQFRQLAGPTPEW
jgi:hypothetical protein